MSAELPPGQAAEPQAFPARVSDIMTQTVVTLLPHHSFSEALALLARHRFRHLLVVGTDRRLIGVISERALLRFLAQHPQNSQAPVDEVMQSPPITAHPDTPLSVAVTALLEHRTNCLPVVDEAGCVCGIVTSTDLLRVLQQALG